MNLTRGEQEGDRRQAARPVLSACLIFVRLLIGGSCRLQSATRTRPLGRPKLPRGRATLAAVVGFLTVALAGPAVSAPAHPTTPVAAPTAGQTTSPQAAPAATECDGAAPLGSVRASGCFDKDPRLGPTRLPTTGPAGSVTAAIAKITAGYQRFGNLSKGTLLSPPPTGYWVPNPPPPETRPRWEYPKNSGFALDENKPIHYTLTLNPGRRAFVDRFGLGTGTFLAPAGTPYAERALPPSSLDTYPHLLGAPKTYHYNYHLYKIVKAFKVDAGPIAPWFGQEGEGLQYITCFSMDLNKPCAAPSVDDLVKQKMLDEQALPVK